MVPHVSLNSNKDRKMEQYQIDWLTSTGFLFYMIVVGLNLFAGFTRMLSRLFSETVQLRDITWLDILKRLLWADGFKFWRAFDESLRMAIPIVIAIVIMLMLIDSIGEEKAIRATGIVFGGLIVHTLFSTLCRIVCKLFQPSNGAARMEPETL
jgi:hypothetical protein